MKAKRIDALSASLRRKKDFAFISALRQKYPSVEVYLVGGIIRDTLLKRNSKDYDFVVRNIPLRALQRVLKSLGTVNLVGRTFGVLKFLPKRSLLNEPIDIALPRTDHSFGTGGYRDVKTQSNPQLPIEDDLLRRDFTVNALALNLGTGKLIDPSGGLIDLAKKTLKTVGDPIERFHEDFTRILRCIRFACQLNFAIDPKTLKAIPKLVHHLKERRDGKFIVPREMIAHEIIKAFVADPVRAFDLVADMGIVHQLMPELEKMKKCPQPANFHREGDVWVHTRLALSILSSPVYRRQFGMGGVNAEIVFGTLFHDLGKPYTIQTPKKDGTDRIRFNNHDTVGAELALTIMKRLSFSVFPKTNDFLHIDPERIAWIIRYHLVGYRNDIDVMRETTVEKYFVNPLFPSESLIKVQYADTAATIHQNGKADFTSFRKILKRVGKIKKTGKKAAVPPLLDGNDVMHTLHMPPGPTIGAILEEIREQQLRNILQTRAQAQEYLRKHFRK
ncbi:MAG TPA: hypothetical protein DIS62_07475 [Candidatus Kerfeldbacteria bacterium]|nr:hypothetical protein [Candidatus Kerfeldbacteria bacterium]